MPWLSSRVASSPSAAAARSWLASVGVCSLKDAHNAGELFRYADLALYWAKSHGRNSTGGYSPSVRRSSTMPRGFYDVGKIAVPDDILLKPGELTADEYEQVKAHAALGADMLADVFTTEQAGWIRHHHERHDGTGYPDRLAGEQIPEGARLLALADAWTR